ncbi:SWIM zinc finger family protein [Paenibacillus eucommiae]|uniref:SWIM-type domain-containing protein n=1 Tax=Paenibacillus eucommiae TaxID=1355755 RepID=A0ABS4IVY0_9BACL|nr:SWIM zinc finger family protein [Paenibacillus eucommiae]MBP1991156.1 hypothetical protein [Paenibacillus eucommiae]
MLDFKLDMNVLSTQMQTRFDTKVLYRGWNCYIEGLVDEIRVEERTVLKSIVWENGANSVHIDLKRFSTSSCTCARGPYCRHLAAVLFEACEMLGENPEPLLNPTHLTALSDDLEFSPNSGLTGLDIYKKLIKKSFDKPKDTGTAEQWHSYFEDQYKQLFRRGTDWGTLYSEVMNKLGLIAESWPPLIRGIYLVHLQLFMMKQADAHYRESMRTYYYYDYSFFKPVSQNCMEQLDQVVSEIDPVNAQREFPQQLKAVADFLAAQVFPEPRTTAIDWNSAYRLLWWNLLNLEEWKHSEQVRLQAFLDDTADVEQVRREAVIMAIVHFDIMAGQDQMALERIDRDIMNPDLTGLFAYLQIFKNLGQWDRLALWLKWLLPNMKFKSYGLHSEYFKFWKMLCANKDMQAEYAQSIIYLLPGSYSYYADHLIENESYKEWVDLCLLLELSPNEVNPAELKIVEVNDRKYLLPLYHRAVERYIQEKNRNSYKMAVRLLKKLAVAYKKLKEPVRWSLYITELSKQHSRLRAFQEELRKGKLIV